MNEVNELPATRNQDSCITETDLAALRRLIDVGLHTYEYVRYEECAHEILLIEFVEADYPEVCSIIVNCCLQESRYETLFGILGKKLCMLSKGFMEYFEVLFAQYYETIDRLELPKLRNLAQFYADLLHSYSLPWSVLSNIVLSKDTTTPLSRLFIAILFQEIAVYFGIHILNERLKDRTLEPFLGGIFPRDNTQNIRFAIDFFTSIGLRGITGELRGHLVTAARAESQEVQVEHLAALNEYSSFDEGSSGSDDSSPSEGRARKRIKLEKFKKPKQVSSK